MGYLTNYTLNTSPGATDEELTAYLVGATDYDDLEVVGGAINDGESLKWYDHERDMKAVSVKNPSVLFILDGEGEEAGDLWRKWFYQGKMFRWDPDIEPPKLSPEGAKALGYKK